jgi:hypothetical protein
MEKENPFKLIGIPQREVPESLKEKVITDVSSAKLVMDMAALFTKNYKATLSSMFLTKKKQSKPTK